MTSILSDCIIGLFKSSKSPKILECLDFIILHHEVSELGFYLLKFGGVWIFYFNVS